MFRSRQAGRFRTGRPHALCMSWRIKDAIVGAGSGRPRQGKRSHQKALRHADEARDQGIWRELPHGLRKTGKSAVSASSKSTADQARDGTRTQDVNSNHTKWCKASDGLVAGLLTDLKARWHVRGYAGGMGRRVRAHSFAQVTAGQTRRKNAGNGTATTTPWGFTMWMAGGGVKRRPDHRHHRMRSACVPWMSRYHVMGRSRLDPLRCSVSIT